MSDLSNVKEIAEQLPPLYNIGVFDGRGGRLRWLTPGVEYTPARPDGPLTLYQCFVDYTKEHCVPEGGDPERAWIAFRAWISALGHDRDVTTLTRADGRRLVEHELARGVSSATARKHLTMGQAALNHAQKEERITKVPKFQCRSFTASRPLAHPRGAPSPHAGAEAVGAADVLAARLCNGRAHRSDPRPDARSSRPRARHHRLSSAGRCVPQQAPRGGSDRGVASPRLVAAFERADPACPLVVSRNGKPYSKGSLYHECKRDLAAIGINERGVARHVARHTAATWMLRGDKERDIPPAPIHQVAQMLGDKVEMIERVYAHVLPTDLQDATRALH
jgi:hypothetical protein